MNEGAQVPVGPDANHQIQQGNAEDKKLFEELKENDPFIANNESLQRELQQQFDPDLLAKVTPEQLEQLRTELRMRHDYWRRNHTAINFPQGGSNSENDLSKYLSEIEKRPETPTSEPVELGSAPDVVAEAPLQQPSSLPEAKPLPVEDPVPEVKGIKTNREMFNELLRVAAFNTNVKLLLELGILFNPQAAGEANRAEIEAAQATLREYYQRYIEGGGTLEGESLGISKPPEPKPAAPPRPEGSKPQKPAEQPVDLEFQARIAEFERLEKQTQKNSYYDILGVKITDSASEIKNAYRKLQRGLHPDSFSSRAPDIAKRGKEAIQRVNEAYEVLSDDDKRKRYDQYRGGYTAPEGGQRGPSGAAQTERGPRTQAEFWQSINDIFTGRGTWDDVYTGSSYLGLESEQKQLEQQLENAPNCRQISKILDKIIEKRARLVVMVDNQQLTLTPQELKQRISAVLNNINQPPAIIDPLIRALPTQFQLRGKVYYEARGRERAHALLAPKGISLARIEESLRLFATYEMVGRLPDGKTKVELGPVYSLFQTVQRNLSKIDKPAVRNLVMNDIQLLSSWADLDVKVFWCLRDRLQCPIKLKTRYDQLVQSMKE